MTLRAKKKFGLSGWGCYPAADCLAYRPEKIGELSHFSMPVILRGAGRAYNDSALNTIGAVVLSERLNRFLDFDAASGVLRAEAGITLAEILDCFVPRGWFLPVVPGTKQVTLGGAVASDVHGKNHHGKGSFGDWIREISLLLANGEIIRCSPEVHRELFWATIGGMGLTGIIIEVVIQLILVETAYMSVRYQPQSDWQKLLAFFSDLRNEDDYSVAWVDGMARGRNEGRSIVMTAHHASRRELPTKQKTVKESTHNVPAGLCSLFLNPTTVKLFNRCYYYANRAITEPFFQDYQTYFFPLDRIENWNRCYGKRGFIQYQCVVPESKAENVIRQIFQKIDAANQSVYLAVLKRFGEQNAGYLSFPMPGITLAIDLPMTDAQPALSRDCDELVLESGGRVYLSKDVFLQPHSFRLMYPDFSNWQKIKETVDPSWKFQSNLSRRLEMEKV